MRVAAILAAGGLGTRLGGDTPKQLLDLGDGSTMLDRSLGVLVQCELIDEVIVAHPPGALVASYSMGQPKPIRSAPGGARRQDSVANALAQVSDSTDLIVIHDAARPFASAVLFERTIRAAARHGAAIAAVPAIDTVKQVEGGTIRLTLPRETIYLAQTPQAFKRDVLQRAMAASAGTLVTDEAMLVERAGFPVHVVEGEVTNIKVTTPEDFETARGLARAKPGEAMRVGTGYDLHRLVEGRPLVLAGVRVPFERGLLGHSDADVVCHAVTDAMLGAAALGDIGRMFPDSEDEWKDADSVELLRAAVRRIQAAGYAVSNVDVTVIAERPKLLPYIAEMRAHLAAALDVPVTAVSVKGKSNEGVGEIGRGEAMACHAVVVLGRGAHTSA